MKTLKEMQTYERRRGYIVLGFLGVGLVASYLANTPSCSYTNCVKRGLTEKLDKNFPNIKPERILIEEICRKDERSFTIRE